MPQDYGMLRLILALVIICLGSFGGSVPQVATAQPVDGTSLRFFGSGPGGYDRVKIPLGPISDGQISSSLPVNVAGDFTLEFWMRAEAAENTAAACEDRGWYYGNIIIDRDVDGPGDAGDYGVALCEGRIAFGVSVGEDDRMVFGTTPVANGQWHHVAVTRADGGVIAIFVDGQLDGQGEGPRGRIDYRTNRATNQPNSDPYLVLGAEKHDYDGSAYYSGFLDDLHLSNQVRYRTNFAAPTAPHQPDTATVALYRFDEGAGTSVGDSSAAPNGPSNGMLMVGGPASGPQWANVTPFQSAPADVATAITQAPTLIDQVPPTPTDTSNPGAATSLPAPSEPSSLDEATSLPVPTGASEPNPTTIEQTSPTTAAPLAASTMPAATPTHEPQVAASGGNIAPPATGSFADSPPPPGESFTPLVLALIITGLGLIISLATVFLWRRRA
jgi:hypothetical protein